MGYCILDDLKNNLSEARLIELTDDTDSGVLNESIVNDNIERASNEINAYCQERYSVPFEIVPGIIKDICIDITIYRLFLRRENVPEDIQNSYKRAVEKLRDIADGKISLGNSNVSEDDITFSNKTEDDRYFKDPEGYL